MAERVRSEPGALRKVFSAAPGSAAWLKRFLIVSLSLLVLALVSGAYAYYRWEARRIEVQKYGEIAAIAQLKVDLVLRWRTERVSDMRRLVESPTLRASLIEWLADPGRPALRADLLHRLALEREVGLYSAATLLNSHGDILLSSGAEAGPIDDAVRQTVERALKSPNAVVGDFHRLGPGSVWIDIGGAIRDSSGRVQAVAILSSSAAEFLYPAIQRWPTLSKTGEALLVKRDGNEVVFLNELRHRANTALVLRQPLTNNTLPASRAVMGQTGLFVGRDYRGVQVMTDLRAVPGTPWFLVTKVDTSEILAEVGVRALAIGAIVSCLILGVATAGAYAYRTRQSDERRQAAVTIGRSEALLKEAQRVAAMGHFEFDLVAGSWTSSDGLDAVLGIGADYSRTVGGWISVVHPDHRIEMLSHLTDHVRKQGLPFNKEYRIIRVGDKAERWVHGVGSLRFGPDGQAVTLFGTIQDVTDRRSLEEELRTRNEDLVRFVYTVSHDLKSPLVTIRTFLGFLEEDHKLTDPSRADEDLGFIRRAADKMTDLLDDLLELSRIGRKVSPPERIGLQALVAEAVDMVAGQLAQRRVAITVTDVPVVLYGDRRRLLELFENLIDNAVKFMGDQPEPRIEIGIDQAGSQPVLYVRDNGLGIDPRHAAKLFGLFEKLHPDSEGTGIGLALAKRIVEIHGGRIWADSPGPGQGSTFCFTLSNTTLNHEAIQQEGH
jgi:signal transduction histidine kinase